MSGREPDGHAGDTDLSEGLMPFPDEIDAKEQFTTSPIDAREFEREWLAALAERARAAFQASQWRRSKLSSQ